MKKIKKFFKKLVDKLWPVNLFRFDIQLFGNYIHIATMMKQWESDLYMFLQFDIKILGFKTSFSLGETREHGIKRRYNKW